MPANFWTTLQIAYYNAAVEQEYLCRFREAIESFKMAKQISLKYLKDEDSDMVQTIDKTLEEVKFKMETREKAHLYR